jgi:hypothetical protein
MSLIPPSIKRLFSDASIGLLVSDVDSLVGVLSQKTVDELLGVTDVTIIHVQTQWYTGKTKI